MKADVVMALPVRIAAARQHDWCNFRGVVTAGLTWHQVVRAGLHWSRDVGDAAPWVRDAGLRAHTLMQMLVVSE